MGLRWTDSRDAIFAVEHLLAQQDSELGIKADYTNEASVIYRQVAEKALMGTGSLDILSTCELDTMRTRAASLMPSWVPDWSTSMRCPFPFVGNWSACAWISPQASIVAGVLTVAGIKVARVSEVHRFPLSEYMEGNTSQIKTILDFTKRIALAGGDLSSEYGYGCRNSLAFHYSDIFLSATESQDSFGQHDDSVLTWTDAFTNLQAYWDGGEFDVNMLPTGEGCLRTLIGRCFFRTSDGHVGVGQDNIELGDAVCVILGWRSPIILRPLTAASGVNTGVHSYVVVGNCYVSGIGNGEVISSIFNNYNVREVLRGEWGMNNARDKTVITDRSQLLEEAGIAVARYQKDPLILEVLPDTLRRNGVKLEELHLQ